MYNDVRISTNYYDGNGNRIYRHLGKPRKASTFNKYSEKATKIEIWHTGVHSFSVEIFKKDSQGRWVCNLRKNNDGFVCDCLTKKQTLMHIVTLKVNEDDAESIIRHEVEESMEAARNAISWCKEEDKDDEDGRYWLSAYHGAQVYRLIVKDGKILGSIPGGIHNSICGNVNMISWERALLAAIEEKAGSDYHLLKADGSGTYFFLRYEEDAKYLHTEIYDVPDLQHGGLHTNIEVK